MSELISKWVQHRLGLVLDMSPEHFAIKTSDGHLLAQLLQSYQIIVPEQLNLIKETDLHKECLNNFKHISSWLKNLNISLADEDLYEIIHGVGTASLHLFYRVLLELKEKTQLDFLTNNEINAQLGGKFSRFQVISVDPNEGPNKVGLNQEVICEPILTNGDVYHWYKDRMENLQNRCKEAREDYIHLLKSRCRPCADSQPRLNESGFVLARSLIVSPRPSYANLNPNELPDEDISYDERTYEELVNKQKEAQELQPIIPNSKEVKKIMKNFKAKSKTRHENKILRNELHQEIMNEFDKKIDASKLQSENRVLTRIFLKQTCFEKELISKMAQVKMHKEYMIENKFKQAEKLNKLKQKEFVDDILLQEKELNAIKLSYYLERERILHLHRKIWEEKLRLRAKNHEILCSDALKDLVDMSIKIYEHKARFGREPSRREMNELKNIFLSGEPAFEICDPVKIIKERDWCEDLPQEEIIRMETLKQNILDQEEFDSYMRYEWPWELKNIESSPDMVEQISCGLNILGHLVHQVLRAKYPLAPTREIPYFPDAAVRVCINGLNDLTYVPLLRNLLSDREIEVVELNQAVDYCLQAYQQESKREYDEEEIVPVKEGKKKKEKSNKLPKKGEKTKNKIKGKSEEEEQISEEAPKVYENKRVQTPKIFPCEEIEYTPKALLGKTAQEILDQGLPLADHLLVAMFVEYLRSIPNLKGWALLNYPTNYEQAALLEEAFTGINILKSGTISPDKKDILKIADIKENTVQDLSLGETLEEKRTSKLVTKPVVAEAVKVYETILTAYIKIKRVAFDEKDGDAILPPVFEELGADADPLDKFYSNTGANYSLYYKDFDVNTIKYLGKLIIGDYSLPIKSSIELFGDGINYMDLSAGATKSLRAAKKGDKVIKPKEKLTKSQAVSVPESSDKKSTKSDKKRKGKVIIVHEDKYTQIPSEDEDEIEELYVAEDFIQISTPGQIGWQYTVVPCPEELMVALATIWETIEEIYVNDLKQIFFLKRLNMNAVLPYAQYVKDIMKKVIDRPDYKGFFLAKFQKAFNVFELDFRKDDEFKAEMFCRIEDFKEKLAEMCDGKMMDSEDERCRIINGNWTSRQITELFNDFVNMFQIELDRFTETIRFINDYYMGVFTNMPCEEELTKEDIFSKISDISPGITNEMLKNVDSDLDLSFFDNLLSNMIQKATACVKKLNTHTSGIMDKIKSVSAASHNLKSKTSSPKSKVSKDDKKSTGDELDLVKENHSKLLEEWQCAIKGESLRVALRLDLLKFNALETFQEFLNALRRCFHDVYKDIRTKYWKEMENIQNVCRIFHNAVENEKPVQKELIFVGHQFYINPELNLFDNASIVPELTKEIVEEGAFTISQLSKLVDIFMDLCPSGYILRSSFYFLLQDILWNNPEDGSDFIAPNLWRKLDLTNLRQVIDALYDDLEYVYWRDFIIYNLRIKYPTEKELLLTGKSLRECDPDAKELVEDYQFYGTKMWFEYCYQQEDADKIKDAKKLLHKIYHVKDYGLNYTALLLDFCKDENILIGLAKALELSLGKMICWNSNMGNDFEELYLKNLREHEEDVRLRDEERAEYYKVAHDEVCKLVDYVVHISEDIIIEDYKEEKPKRKEPKAAEKLNSKKEDPVKLKRSSILKKSLDSTRGKKNSKGEEIKLTSGFVKTEDYVAKEKSKQSVNTNEESKSVDIHQDSIIMKIYKDLPNNVDTEASEYTQILFFLPLDVLFIVITAALPWHSRVQQYEELSFMEQTAEIYEKCRNPNFNMAVLTHEFLNSNDFLSLLGETKKFKAIDPVKVVKNVLEEY